MDRRQRLLLPMTHPDISVSRLRQALRIEGPVPLAWLRGEAWQSPTASVAKRKAGAAFVDPPSAESAVAGAEGSEPAMSGPPA